MASYKFRVLADTMYLDGFLANVPLADGYSLSAPDRRHAQRIAAWLARVQKDDDFVRAAVTGHRYKVLGNIRVERI